MLRFVSRSFRYSLLSTMVLLVSGSAQAELVDFDDLPLSSESFYNGSDLSGGFTSHGVGFGNSYNSTWDTWNGFSYSNTSDTTTGDYFNQYSAITGTGNGPGQDNYGVAFGYHNIGSVFGDPPFDPTDAGQLSSLPHFTLAPGTSIVGAQVTNTTYAALTMQNGDAFSKQFGGSTGSDPDWFKLSAYGTDEHGNVLSASAEFYLADFRNADDSLDYIVDQWTFFDLSALAGAHEIYFNLSSSDVGGFGMNTPSFFAIDDIEVNHVSAVPEPSSLVLLLAGGIGLLCWRRGRKLGRSA